MRQENKKTDKNFIVLLRGGNGVAVFQDQAEPGTSKCRYPEIPERYKDVWHRYFPVLPGDRHSGHLFVIATSLAPASYVASSTAFFSTSVTPLGTQTLIRGLRKRDLPQDF